MNIIFGREQAAALSERYTVLELDTIKVGTNTQEMVAFCVVENIPIIDMPRLEKMKELHSNLIIEYKKQNWNYCEQAMEHLVGCWNHELDTFYDNLKQRIAEYKEQSLSDDWTGVIVKDPL